MRQSSKRVVVRHAVRRREIARSYHDTHTHTPLAHLDGQDMTFTGGVLRVSRTANIHVARGRQNRVATLVVCHCFRTGCAAKVCVRSAPSAFVRPPVSQGQNTTASSVRYETPPTRFRFLKIFSYSIGSYVNNIFPTYLPAGATTYNVTFVLRPVTLRF